MSTATVPRIVTWEEFYRMGDAAGGFELVNGELKELDMSAESSRIGGRVYNRLENYSELKQPGWAFPPETGYRCFSHEPNLVRKPDASFIALNRFTPKQYTEEGFIEVVPDLLAEVISPNDIAEEVDEKIGLWLGAGVKVLWEVFPSTRTVRVHRPNEKIAVLRVSDTLTAEDILPGFACPVADLFRLPGEPPPSA